jgi:Pvc16 N-terminal domain
MINEALTFLVAQLNEYFISKMGASAMLGGGGFVVQKRIVKNNGDEVVGENKIVCQLVNVEEERVGKAQLPVAPPSGSSFPVRNPEIRVNLSVLFTAISPATTDALGDDEIEYVTSIKMLAYVIQFFQYRHVFTTENSPSLPASVGNILVELYPISLENQNYLWASLGAKYRPSVVYKVRLITIFEDTFSEVVGVPRTLNSNTNNLS